MKCLSLLTLASGALATHDPFAQYREKRALGERNVVALVLSKEKCALISSALDDCKIAACRDEERRPIKSKGQVNAAIPEGAICRVKCRSVKSQRCICCANGFEIGRECPEDAKSCALQEDQRALYEGPGAELFAAQSWRHCYEECNNRGMNCRAASFVKLRFNSMCWIFNEVTTRYADDVNNNVNQRPGGFGSGNMFNTRSLQKKTKSKGRFGYEQRPIDDMMPDYILPALPATPLGVNSRSFGMGFRNPYQAPQAQISIAKGDARAPEANGLSREENEPEMISWHRECN